MKSGGLLRACAVLIALCCLLPIAVLAAVLFFNAPVWPTSLAALLVMGLLASRLFRLLGTPESDDSRSSGSFSSEEGLLGHDYRQH